MFFKAIATGIVAICLSGCVQVSTTSVEPARAGVVERSAQSKPFARQRLLCQRPSQVRDAVNTLTLAQLRGIEFVPRGNLPSGCKAGLVTANVDARYFGASFTRDREARVAVIELSLLEPAGSPFEPTVFAYTVDTQNVRQLPRF